MIVIALDLMEPCLCLSLHMRTRNSSLGESKIVEMRSTNIQSYDDTSFLVLPFGFFTDGVQLLGRKHNHLFQFFRAQSPKFHLN